MGARRKQAAEQRQLHALLDESVTTGATGLAEGPPRPASSRCPCRERTDQQAVNNDTAGRWSGERCPPMPLDPQSGYVAAYCQGSA